MIDPSLLALCIVTGFGAVAGGLGALLGIGGGVFLVPALILVLDLPVRGAVAISLTTVVATSTAVSAGAARRLVNQRLGMLLETWTVGGALLGSLTTQALPNRARLLLFSLTTAAIAGIMLGRLERRNVILDPDIDPGLLGGRYYELESEGDVIYRVRRLPLGMAASFVAGILSSWLGIGGGIVKVPALNAWCGVPMRAAAATSAFMIGVTATAALPIYYAHGDLVPHLAAGAVLGVLIGSRLALRWGERSRAKWLKLLMAGVLLLVSGLMFLRW
jgi:hypothetical protein